jgi:putative transposase
MPWSETTKMRERVRFIGDLEGELFSKTELCQRYGISRMTGYKWAERTRKKALRV